MGKRPREDFFNVLQQELGKVPIIAEDLGELVRFHQRIALKTGFPGCVFFNLALIRTVRSPIIFRSCIRKLCRIYRHTTTQPPNNGWHQ